MKISIDDLTIDAHPIRPRSDELLASWQWLALPEGVQVVGVSRMGDLFLQQESGHIHLLDTHFGRCTHVASTGPELMEGIAENFREWFRAELCVAAMTHGIELAPGQVYSFMHPLALGGEAALENMKACDLFVHVGLQGQVLEQIAGLPPGTPVEVRVLDTPPGEATKKKVAKKATKKVVKKATKKVAKKATKKAAKKKLAPKSTKKSAQKPAKAAKKSARKPAKAAKKSAKKAAPKPKKAAAKKAAKKAPKKAAKKTATKSPRKTK